MKRRFTRRFRCPVCGGGDDMPRGREVRCSGYISDDQRFAHCSRRECGSLESGGTYAHFVDGPCRCGETHGGAVLPPVPIVAPAPRRRDVAALWSGLSLRDSEAESYLQHRGLWGESGAGSDLLRFNSSVLGDPWLAARSAEGYRIAFAVRGPTGIRSVSLRSIREGVVPKALCLPNETIAGAAICAQWLGHAVSGDDEIALCEGGTDVIALTIARGREHRQGLRPRSHVLGCIGAAAAAGVIRGFASVIRRRVISICLDADEVGRRCAVLAAEAARECGALEVRIEEPPSGKDWAEMEARPR